MMKQSTTSLLKAAATFILLISIALSAYLSERTLMVGGSISSYMMKFDVSKPFESLTEQEKIERVYQVVANTVIDDIAEIKRQSFVHNLTNFGKSPAWLTYLSGLLILLASIGDYCRHRKEESEKHNRRPRQPKLTGSDGTTQPIQKG